jgi:hypothetical protein
MKQVIYKLFRLIKRLFLAISVHLHIQVGQIADAKDNEEEDEVVKKEDL